MTIQKGKFKAKLKIQLAELFRVDLSHPKYGWVLHVVPLETILGMHNKERKPGMPEFVALQGGDLLVYPISDKRYKLRVVGTQYIEQ